MANYPDNLKYTKEHEWARIEGKTATIGITDHAQSSLGDIVFVELPESGSELTQGGTFGVVESVKAVSDLYSPINGKVSEVNSSVVDEPSTLNNDPYESGWLVKVEMGDDSTPADLMDAAQYQDFVATEG